MGRSRCRARRAPRPRLRRVSPLRSSGAATKAQTRVYAEQADVLVSQLRAEIGTPAVAARSPALIVLMGLPGVGKSHCARLLAARRRRARATDDHSEADEGVYDRMRERPFEPPAEGHLELANGPAVIIEIERIAAEVERVCASAT